MYRSSKSHPSWFATKINEPYYIETQDTGTQCLCLNPTYHPIIPLYNHYAAPLTLNKGNISYLIANNASQH